MKEHDISIQSSEWYQNIIKLQTEDLKKTTAVEEGKLKMQTAKYAFWTVIISIFAFLINFYVNNQVIAVENKLTGQITSKDVQLSLRDLEIAKMKERLEKLEESKKN